jgi:hypothetical protein
VSPYIEATFVQDNHERVDINHSVVDTKKLHVETSNGVLRVYLDGAKEIPRDSRENKRSGRPLYPNRAITVTIYYKTLNSLSLRGEERFECISPLSTPHFTLKLYGEPDVSFAKVDFDDLQATIYGEGSLHIQAGSINKQSYTCYGEGNVNTTSITGSEAKLTAYGETNFSLNVSDRIRITSFGEASLRYKGNPQIVKGLHFGEVDVARLD